MTREKRAIYSWAMYDWANSAFATSVMTVFFPTFFKKYWSGTASSKRGGENRMAPENPSPNGKESYL